MYEKQKNERKEERAKYREKVICNLHKFWIELYSQYKLEPTPDPTDDEEDDSEEEEEDDDMFGGGAGADDPAAQAASK